MNTLNRKNDDYIAYTSLAPKSNKPTLVWLSGFKSDMSGGKAVAVKDWSENNGFGYLAFDYFGHGSSSGDFAKGTISLWRDDCLAAIDELTDTPLILIGSSMGGWMALLTALARKDRVVGMLLIAPAPDFTQKLMWPGLTGPAQKEIATNGYWMRENDYGPPYPITRDLIEDGKQWSILDDPIELDVPVTILQGQEDVDVPWQHALKVSDALTSPTVRFHLIKDGDHRLSRDQDISRLLSEVGFLCDEVG